MLRVYLALREFPDNYLISKYKTDNLVEPRGIEPLTS